MTNSIILMTALVPTTGHADLIKFGANIPNNNVKVLINSRSFEPVSGLDRLCALEKHFYSYKNVEFSFSEDDKAPQNPTDHPFFWDWWRDEINHNFPDTDWDYVIASEPYGENVAKSLDATFLPYDIERELNKARGSCLRSDFYTNWEDIIPEAKSLFSITATFFGQESVGKTTLSKLVSKQVKSTWLMEYARPYLETVGPQITDAKMHSIHAGQLSLQNKAKSESRNPFILQDTDLFSTVGYWKIFKKSPPKELKSDARGAKSDIYYLLKDEIPFEPDPLRYGGNKRESSFSFWEELLIKEGLEYVIVPSGTLEEKEAFVINDLMSRFHEKNKNIFLFERE